MGGPGRTRREDDRRTESEEEEGSECGVWRSKAQGARS